MATYTVAEVFQVAMEMENAGRVFYETLADASSDEKLSDLCRDLAAQETDHFQLLRKMGDELVQRPSSRPVTWDELNFAQMLIEERMLPDLDDARDAASRGDLSSVLDTAIQLEKDSVLFYGEMLDEVYENDVAAVQEIIDEEKRHVLALVKAKKQLT
jgi:rubrerythrin